MLAEGFAFLHCAFLICELALHHTGYPVAAFSKLTHQAEANFFFLVVNQQEVQVFWSNTIDLIGKNRYQEQSEVVKGPWVNSQGGVRIAKLADPEACQLV